MLLVCCYSLLVVVIVVAAVRPPSSQTVLVCDAPFVLSTALCCLQTLILLRSSLISITRTISSLLRIAHWGSLHQKSKDTLEQQWSHTCNTIAITTTTTTTTATTQRLGDNRTTIADPLCSNFFSVAKFSCFVLVSALAMVSCAMCLQGHRRENKWMMWPLAIGNLGKMRETKKKRIRYHKRNPQFLFVCTRCKFLNAFNENRLNLH